MRYGDLIQFDPIESVIQLREADAKDEARRLVKTYVFSERMAQVFGAVIVPQLQIDQPRDNKGLFIVGNYGTGKSHLMSVLSAIAEHGDLVEFLHQPEKGDMRQDAKKIGGRFQVIRAEIGSVTMNLRDIVVEELAKGLARMGVTFQFPARSEVSNNKDALVAMMGAFQEKFGDQTGLLFVLDELLEFLRSRDQQALILDLSFLRELGEVCRLTKFRFMAGIQESLFDNPRFQFVAQPLLRVRDRFEQVRIAREDVAYVVSERLLKKTPKQMAQVREHLQKFTPLYSSMAEKLDEFVRLFPVHPAYLEVLERVTIVEQRQALKTISLMMSERLDKTVPNDEPGLIAYDSYWQFVLDAPALRSIPEIKLVLDKSSVLEERIRHAFPKPHTKPMALRIINALSVQRLTTDGLDTPIGVTSDELRDDLCLYVPMPVAEADFLKTTVDATLAAIISTVSGQFISQNPENGQYYLDLKKDIDFDAQIQTRAETLSQDTLNNYFYEALANVLEINEPQYVTGFRIWSYEVEWRGHGITRPGYLFLGTPNERSTAQPPREFYIYVLQPYDTPKFTDAQQGDEIFVRLAKTDTDFETRLKLYAGAREWIPSASGENRKTYEAKAGEHLKKLALWLREHLNQNFQVTYKGVSKSVLEWTKGQLGVRSNLAPREQLNAVAAIALNTQFDEVLPSYPKFAFREPVTQANLGATAQEAVQWLTSPIKTQPGAIVLDGLELKDGDRVTARDGRYGKYFLGLLNAKGEGQVVNRNEILENYFGVERDPHFKLEPEWVAVTLLAFVHQGEMALAIPGKKIDAGSLDETTKLSIKDLREFRHIERPKGMPFGPLKALCNLVGVREGLVNENDKGELVTDLQAKVANLLQTAVNTLQLLQKGLPVWNTGVLEGAAQADALQRVEKYKSFLESLQSYNTAPKLKNFRYTTAEVETQRPNHALLSDIGQIADVVGVLQPLTSYLSTALAALPADDPIAVKIRQTQDSQLARLREPHANFAQLRPVLLNELESLKREYIKAYLELHKRARLNMTEDKRKAKLLSDPSFDQLKRLKSIPFMPLSQLTDFQNALAKIKMCPAIGESDLAASPFCPNCNYRPLDEPMTLSAQAQLVNLETRLQDLHAEWVKSLQINLEDPSVHGNMSALKPAQRKKLEQFLKDVELPHPITDDFIQAVNDAFQGLDRVVITPDQVTRALSEGGLPCTPQELQTRFQNFVSSLTMGHDASKVRVVIESAVEQPIQ